MASKEKDALGQSERVLFRRGGQGLMPGVFKLKFLTAPDANAVTRRALKAQQ